MLSLRHSIKQAELQHILAHPRDIERAVSFNCDHFVQVVCSKPTTGAVLFDERDEPIVAGGITVLRDPHAFAWLVASRNIKPYLRVILPVIKAHLTTAALAGLNVRASITPGIETADRFARKLGFVQDEQPGNRIFSGIPQ
jgi:hypothetical protein